jgi:tetratricopeptide (TPR) repeat protein
MLKQFLFTVLFLLPLIDYGQTRDNMECRALYDAEKFQEAYECYSKDENEIFSVYMSAYLAKFLEYKKEYKQWKKRLESDAFNSSETFYYAAHLYPGNSKKFLKSIDKGLREYQNDTLLLIEKVNYYIEIGEYEEGIPILEKLIQLKENDLVIFLTIANIYNDVSKYQKAIPYFQMALSKRPRNYEANYGLGLIYFNQAADLLNIANKITDQDEIEGLEKEAKSLLQKALPYLQFAFDQTPDNKGLKSALLTCYLRLEMDAEYNSLKDS